MEQTFGTWYVRGGLRALADAVHQRCLARRVGFVFGAEVVGVVEEGGRAAGVELADGRVADADLVVAGAPVPPCTGTTWWRGSGRTRGRGSRRVW